MQVNQDPDDISGLLGVIEMKGLNSKFSYNGYRYLQLLHTTYLRS
jgi:hypothetical protein